MRNCEVHGPYIADTSTDFGETWCPECGPRNHGAPSPVPVEAILSDDPELALVTADMDVWAAAHPCECQGVCECEQ